MLLAEALANRKAALTKLSELEGRITNAAISYEGETPDEKASDLMKEHVALATEFETLSTRINRTNNDITIHFDGREMTMMEAVALRENLLLQHRAYKRIAEQLDSTLGRGQFRHYAGRRTKEDLKQEVHLAPKEVRKTSDQLAERIQRLNIAMQSVNWTTELIES